MGKSADLRGATRRLASRRVTRHHRALDPLPENAHAQPIIDVADVELLRQGS